MKAFTFRGLKDFAQVVRGIDARRQQKKRTWRDVYDRTPEGKHNGFSRVVVRVADDKPVDFTFQTFLGLLEALDLECEIRPRPVQSKRVLRVPTSEALAPSADPPGGVPGE